MTSRASLSASEKGERGVGWRLPWLGQPKRRRRGRRGPRGGQAEMKERGGGNRVFLLIFQSSLLIFGNANRK